MNCPYVMKKCNECGRILFLFKFKKRKSCKFGRDNKCKECHNKNSKKYTVTKEKRKEYNSNFYSNDENRKKKYEYNKDYNKSYKRKNNNSKEYTYNHTCAYCGNTFTSHRKTTKYCSQKCVGASQRKREDYESKDCRDRNGIGYLTWRKSVFERDDYTCQCCGKHGGQLVAHHLNGYHWFIEGRTDVNNGVTICDECHKKFHKTYGNKNNTKEQCEEFINKNK